MTSNFDADIYRDFVIEAGEILDKLGEELVRLDQAPRDMELLNSIFRGFHTIKGGASFLGIEAIVALCHGAEDIFSHCRTGEIALDAAGIDVVLRTVDALTGAFDTLRAGGVPDTAAAGLIADLRAYVTRARSPDHAAAPAAAAPPQAPPQRVNENVRQPNGDTISDDEFEALLDRLHGKSKSVNDTRSSPPPMPPAKDVARQGAASSVIAEPSAPAPVAADKPARQPEATLRIETRRLDDIMNLVGELVLARNRLLSTEALLRDERAAKTISDIDVLISDLQVAVMKSRMQPIQKIFSRFPRVVRDLARSLNKEVELRISGEETDLEKNMVESLADPLVHLVRNAIDHGIESVAEREAAGKARHGTVQLAAYQEGDRVVVTIIDDGAGIDTERLREAAVSRKLMDQASAQRLTAQECVELIFLPGLTTRRQASDISGRGVGMDVVRTRIEQLGGTVEVTSERGAGTTVRIRLPLTLAILPTLMIGVGDQVFAVPLACVVEIIRVNLRDARVVDGQPVIIVRGKPLPLFYLGRWLLRNAGYQPADDAQVIVTRVGPRHVAFVVDSLIGQEESVIKSLGALVHGTRGLAGATITGDGHVALILDVPELLAAHALKRAAGA